jgi:hypothetical protein
LTLLIQQVSMNVLIASARRAFLNNLSIIAHLQTVKPNKAWSLINA